MNETTQPKTKGLFKRRSHKIQKTLRISKTKSKYNKHFDLDDLITEQISVDDEHTMSKLAQSIKMLDIDVKEHIVEEVVIKEPPTLSKIYRSKKMTNLLLEEDLSEDKDTISTNNDCLHDLCLQDVCLQDEEYTCDNEICFREVTIMNISGANGKKPTYKITNTCRCPKLRLC